MNSRMLIIVCILLLLDIYIVFGIKALVTKTSQQSIAMLSYIAVAIIAYIGFFTLTNTFEERPIGATSVKNLLIGFGFSFIIFKLLFAVFLVLDDVVRIFQYIFEMVHKFFYKNPSDIQLQERRNFIVKTGLVVAGIPFVSMLYGITKGKYNYTVKNIALKFPNLPKAFDGFKLVQISDIHSGSFDSAEEVAKGVDLINEQKADIVFFTGDLVNNDAREVEPYINVFKKIKSTEGTYSILGNHDYGDYKKWDSKEEKEANFKLLETHQKAMNFQLLKNESKTITRGADTIQVLGVENWGKPPFPTHGDLDKALSGVEEQTFKILLSHDPSHWDAKVIPHQTNIDLTLSGHTHGMQFGVDIPGIKWSPVKYRYPRWSGLYENAKQYLYVNRGFGFLGFPGRVGMWPEITVIELKKT